MSVVFDGKRFLLCWSDGRKANLLEVDDTCANKAPRSFLQRPHDYGTALAEEEENLVTLLLRIFSEGEEETGTEIENALCLLLLQNLTKVPRAARILLVGGTAGSRLVRVLSDIFRVLEMEIQFSVATDLDDHSMSPTGVLPIRTILKELLFPEETADVLVVDARRIPEKETCEILTAAQRALCGDGIAFVLGGTEKSFHDFEKNFYRRIRLDMPTDGEMLHVGWKEEKGSTRTGDISSWSEASKRRKELMEERHALAGKLAQLRANDALLSEVIRAVRTYGESLLVSQKVLLRSDEKYQAARLLEFLIDWKLGQGGDHIEELAYWSRYVSDENYHV